MKKKTCKQQTELNQLNLVRTCNIKLHQNWKQQNQGNTVTCIQSHGKTNRCSCTAAKCSWHSTYFCAAVSPCVCL